MATIATAANRLHAILRRVWGNDADVLDCAAIAKSLNDTATDPFFRIDRDLRGRKLTIDRNWHKKYGAAIERRGEPIWRDDESKQRASETDSVWVMQVGGALLAAATLVDLLDLAETEFGFEENGYDA